MAHVNLSFQISGNTLPVDHGYALFGAISKVLPELHHPETQLDFAILPIQGTATGQRNLRLSRGSRLTIRMPSEDIGKYLPLCGQSLNVQGHVLTIGVPEVSPLSPAPVLTSRLVTIKHHLEISTFLPAVVAELQRLEIQGTASLVARTAPGSVEGNAPAEGHPARDPFIRRTLRIADKEIVGFALTVSELSTEDSLKLQTVGLGGRRHFGCGVFVPVK